MGGPEYAARTSGLADHFAVDEPDALRQARRVVAASPQGYGPTAVAERAHGPRKSSHVPATCAPPSTRAR
ncbi:hypothetical protein [Streptomyces sp. DHE17-7]|uniref:hypothetical protein n=1 Tax=Streptomyces sp. DHE17-7 TaxID=2759949 RepID=UPI002FCDFDC6